MAEIGLPMPAGFFKEAHRVQGIRQVVVQLGGIRVLDGAPIRPRVRSVWPGLAIYQNDDVSVSYWPITLVFAVPSAFMLLTRTRSRNSGFELITS
jgi:hypothetical protein